MVSESVGWDAIDGALERIYPGVEPQHFGTLLKWRLGGPDPLDGISYYPRTEPVPHWHIVTYGMSELYAKESDDAAVSGWGFEFTFRVARDPADTEPPIWAANFLQNAARYVFGTGNVFEPGHYVDANGPIELNCGTLLHAVVFAEDPELGTIDSPHGSLVFLQAVGITKDELAAVETWNTLRFLELAGPRLPLLVSDLGRPSLMDDPAFAAAVEAGRAADGSSAGALFIPVLAWRRDDDGVHVRFGAQAAEQVAQALRGRLPFGRAFSLEGPTGGVEFSAGDSFRCTDRADRLAIVLPQPVLDSLTTVLEPRAGTHRIPGAPGFTLEILRSEIRDAAGEVIRTIG